MTPNSLPAQATQPLSYPPDTVEFSAANKIKAQNQKKKQGMSNLTICGICIAGIITACIATKKFYPSMKMQSRLKECFFRDFTKPEAEALQKKYQEILKISNKDEFLEKAFKELKKDYGLDDIPIVLDKTFKSGEQCDAIKAAASTSLCIKENCIKVNIDATFSNETLFRNLTHELRHDLQLKKMYQCSTKEDYLAAMKKRVKNTLGLKNPDEIEEFAKDLYNEYRAFFDKLNLKKINEEDFDYEYARKVLESFGEYANKSKEAYRTTFYESDAKHIENILDAVIHNEIFPSNKVAK